MKQIIVWLVIVTILLGIIFWSRSINISTQSATNIWSGISSDNLSDLVVKNSLYDFGSIKMSDGDVDHTFTIVNPTDHDIKVDWLYTSCMCTNAFLESSSGEKGPFGMEGMGYVPPVNEIIKPGGSVDVRVVYDPNAHGPAGVGTIDRFVMLTDDQGRQLQLEIRAIVTP